MMIRFLLLLLFAMVLSACGSHKEKSSEPRVLSVYPKNTLFHLYYSGTIKPLEQELVISPASGIISKMSFHYGDFVKKGDVLFTLHSPELETEFREAISNYLRVKQSFLTSKKSMTGTEMLFKEKIISEQEYLSEQNQYRNNLLSYIEATTKLEQFLVNLPAYQQKIINLSNFDLEEAEKILQEKLEDLTIYAPTSGIILFPEEKTSDGMKELQVGSLFKKNDVLLEIGNLSGISISANVSENDINHLKPGVSVLITFSSESELELRGAIISIAKQAKNTENTGFSTFPVVIHVPKITDDQLQKIRVGMNAKLDILIEEGASIKIPIEAVYQKDNRNWVKKINPSNGKIQEVEVETGPTTQYEVTILKGIKQGDKVLLHD